MLEVGGPLLLVGGGKMGGALLAGWIEQGVKPSEVSVVEPNRDAAEAVAATGAR
ncbi:MAG: NAD(P)-binding domain-containing protein, partial [Rhodospirillales bacterium]|nr:NAD(P)-binding domain-containing protein [Rhodospirillales bacterium]